MSLKTSSNIADRKVDMGVGVSTQPCLTPFVTLNDSETVKFPGHPYFLSSCHSLVLPTVSNALLKSTNTMNSGWSCSMHLSCICRRQHITSTVLWLHLKPHCVSGTTSCVVLVDSRLRRILAKILPAMERREIPL